MPVKIATGDIMITLQYVNDLAVLTAQHHKKNNSFEFSRIAKRILKDDRYRSIFIIEYNNAYGQAILRLY